MTPSPVSVQSSWADEYWKEEHWESKTIPRQKAKHVQLESISWTRGSPWDLSLPRESHTVEKKKKPWEYNEWDLGQEKFMGLTNCPSIMWPEGYQGINLAMPRSHVRLPPFTLGIPMLPSPTLAPIQPVVLTPASSASPALCSIDEISSLLPQKPLLIESADTVAQMTPLASQSLLSRCTWRWH